MDLAKRRQKESFYNSKCAFKNMSLVQYSQYGRLFFVEVAVRDENGTWEKVRDIAKNADRARARIVKHNQKNIKFL